MCHRHNLQKETQLRILQPRMADTCPRIFGPHGNRAITISPKALKHIYPHTHVYGIPRLEYIRFMIATVRVRDRRYMFYVGIVRAAEKFHFSAEPAAG